MDKKTDSVQAKHSEFSNPPPQQLITTNDSKKESTLWAVISHPVTLLYLATV